MKYTIYFLMSCLCLSIGCGKEKTVEVAKGEPTKENGEGEARGTTKVAPVVTLKQAKSPSKSGTGRGPGGGFSRGNRSRNPFAELGVTASQQEKLDAAREEMVNLFTPLFADQDISREEREAKMREIREAYAAKVKEILTEEQFAKYQEAQSSREQGRAGGRGNSLASLNLTEDQREKIAAIQTEQRAEQTELFQEMRANGGGFDGVREKMTALRAKYDQEIEALLTDEQKEKYKEIQAQRSQRGQRRPSDGSKGGRRPSGGSSREKSKGDRKD